MRISAWRKKVSSSFINFESECTSTASKKRFNVSTARPSCFCWSSFSTRISLTLQTTPQGEGFWLRMAASKGSSSNRNALRPKGYSSTRKRSGFSFSKRAKRFFWRCSLIWSRDICACELKSPLKPVSICSSGRRRTLTCFGIFVSKCGPPMISNTS